MPVRSGMTHLPVVTVVVVLPAGAAGEPPAWVGLSPVSENEQARVLDRKVRMTMQVTTPPNLVA